MIDDDKIFPEPETTIAFRVWAIYASYDGNAPNTCDVIFVSCEELAQAVCEKLNENPRKWAGLAFVEGYEYSKSFKYHERVKMSPDMIRRSVKEVFDKDAEEDEDYED